MNADMQNYMDKTKKINDQLKELMIGGSFSEILERCRILRAKMRESKGNSEQQIMKLNQTIESSIGKDSKFNRNQERKDNVLTNDKREIEKFEDLAKSRLDTIKFKKLPKVKRDSEVEEFFKFFFTYLYKEDSFKFDYANFVKFAIKKNVGEFKKRLAQFEITNLGKNGLSMLEDVRY